MQTVLTSSRTTRAVLNYVPFVKRFPKCYQQFLEDLKRPRTPVNYRPIKERFYWNKDLGSAFPVPDAPIPSIFPPESMKGLWGGEGIVQGYIHMPPKKALYTNALKTRCYMWVPEVMSIVLYSEVLDKYLKTEVTLHALEQIDKNFGLDLYLLQTPVQDLNSQLAFDLCRKILLALARRDLYPNDAEKRERILAKYDRFIIPEEEAEWFGLNIREATWKLLEQEQYAMWQGTPLKHKLRADLIARLKAEQSGSKANETTAT